MRCRRLKIWKDENDNIKKSVVWFGSYGKDENGKAKFYSTSNIHDNFSEKLQGLSDSLTQRLSILLGELWYNVSYGIPLFKKQKSKLSMDSFVIKTILNHPDVKEISEFESQIVDRHYSCDMKILSVYGDLELNI